MEGPAPDAAAAAPFAAAPSPSPGPLRVAARAALLGACSVVVVVQLSQCFHRLLSPPMTTHASVVLNASLTYPAVTVCRLPAYRSAVLKKYELADVTKTSQWEHFPYDEVPLQEFWDEASFNASEVLLSTALHELPDNVEVSASTFLQAGRCFSVRPHGPGAAQPARDARQGYSILLGHARNAPLGDPTAGWTVFVHEDDQPFIEEGGHSSGQQEPLFVEVGEELHVRVSVQEYVLADRPQRRCNASHGYSYVQCRARCHWERLAAAAGCSAPWLPLDPAQHPHCASAPAHRALLVAYLNEECEEPCCGCVRRCRNRQLRPLVVKRRLLETTTANHPLSLLYVAYANRVVTRAEERAAYGWSAFLADVGGSLGFLLGLSVLGAVDALERVLRHARRLCARPRPRRPSAPDVPDAPDTPDTSDALAAPRRPAQDAVLHAILSFK